MSFFWKRQPRLGRCQHMAMSRPSDCTLAAKSSSSQALSMGWLASTMSAPEGITVGDMLRKRPRPEEELCSAPSVELCSAMPLCTSTLVLERVPRSRRFDQRKAPAEGSRGTNICPSCSGKEESRQRPTTWRSSAWRSIASSLAEPADRRSTVARRLLSVDCTLSITTPSTLLLRPSSEAKTKRARRPPKPGSPTAAHALYTSTCSSKSDWCWVASPAMRRLAASRALPPMKKTEPGAVRIDATCAASSSRP
mmetsp:Transcript_56972/g.167275  ORF Transcript_56972/g.167275 Transcript_56972/m.167275 type:complete len:252 (-) Transcript_56972:1352-2107(-)